MYSTEEAAITAAKANIKGYTDFGSDCDDCAGWDGESRRCQCGNRRVAWVTEIDSEGKFYAYAEAY